MQELWAVEDPEFARFLKRFDGRMANLRERDRADNIINWQGNRLMLTDAQARYQKMTTDIVVCMFVFYNRMFIRLTYVLCTFNVL